MTRSNAKPGRPGRALAHGVARSMGIPARALPVLDELFSGCRSLGTPPLRVARWLRGHGVGKTDLVIDLGCGKGAASIGVASACGCRVLGVDAFPAFVGAATAAALRRGVDGLCEFRVGDVLWGWRGAKRDAAIMLNVAALEDALPVLRRVVRRGGVYVVDDAVVVRGEAGGGGVLTLDEARAMIERRRGGGHDTILREHRFRLHELRRSHATIERKLRASAAALVRREPRWRVVVAECLRRHRAAAEMLQGDVRPVVWLVRRGS